MLVSPSKVKENRILKGRTLNFETVRKTHGNIVLMPSFDINEVFECVSGNLFRPNQLTALFTPRVIKALGRSQKIIKQAQFYKIAKEKTKGRIKLGKTTLESFDGRNVLYDINTSLNHVYNVFSEIRSGIMLEKTVKEYMESLINNITSDADYPDVYLVFPMVDYIENLNRRFLQLKMVEKEDLSPIAVFLRSLMQKTANFEVYKKIKGIFFYNPNADAIVKLTDMKSERYEEELLVNFQRILRLNAYNGRLDTLDDIEVIEDNLSINNELDQEESIENKKEEIKEIVLSKIGKKLKANFSDYSAASKDEQELITAIDQKIDDFLAKEENGDKTFADLVKDVEEDNAIKLLSIKYIESKKISQQKLAQLSKNLDKENEILDNIEGLDNDEKVFEAKKFDVKVPELDERIKQSALAAIDEEYNLKQADKDLMNIIGAFSSNPYLPLTIDSFEKEDTSDDFDAKYTIKVRYKTDDNKALSFVLDIPKVIEKRYFYLGGNRKIMNRQLLRLPIIKTKVDRVEITSSFNKMTIERSSGNLSRKNAYLLKYLKKAELDPSVKVFYGSNEVINGNYKNNFEYEELSENISSIFTPQYQLYFNREMIQPEIDAINIPEEFLKEDLTPVGFRVKGTGEKKSFIFIDGEDVQEVSLDGATIEHTKHGKAIAEFIFEDVLKADKSKLPNIGKTFIYTKVKFLATTYPIFVVVGLTNGLTDILRRYGVEYKVTTKPLARTTEFVQVKFKDKYLYYKDTIQNTLLLNALYLMNTEEYNMSDFDLDVPYNDYFIAKLGSRVGIHTKNTLKINLSVMIDPITRDVLKDLHMPTNITDLLLRANTMLINSAYRPQNDVRNYRLRGTESLYSMLYEVLANAYVSYQRHRINGRALNLDLPRNKLISRFLTENIVGEFSFLNPALESEGLAWASAKGPRGVNIAKAFTLEMRTYDKSMNGILSGNSTPYSGSAGITRSLSYDPKITSVRGYIPDVDPDTISATNMLSPVELLAPFTATGADSARQAMQISQTKHIMPTVKTSRQLVSSGLNRTLPFMLSDAFCFKAKNDGKVLSIDNDRKIALLEYVDGSKDAVDIGSSLSKNANSGFFIQQEFVFVYSEGEKFEKDDVLAYNPQFFAGKGKDVEYKQGVLAKIAIAPGDFSFEDSTLISRKLAEKCRSYVVMEKAVSLGPNAIIHKMASVGQPVKTGDHLLDFTASFTDADTSEFLQSLANQIDPESFEAITHEAVKSKYSGDIVDIKVYYNTDLENLSPSLQKLIRNYSARINKRREAIAGFTPSSLRIPPVQKVSETKIGKTEFAPEGGVIIQFFIRYVSDMDEGNKLSFATALKGVISNCLDEDESPICEYRPEEVIEGILTPTGVISRMTSDIYKLMFSGKVLVEVGKQCREIWEGKR